MSAANKAHRLRMAADICVLHRLDGVLQVLLIRRAKDPFKGCWALPGGRLEADETLDQCAVRELREETGLHPKSIRQCAIFSEPRRDPRERTVSAAYVAWVDDISEMKAGSDAAVAAWFSTSSLPDLAFDHQMILETCLSDLLSTSEPRENE
jgi:8-oxo-dGTP diphosphatase